MRRLKLYTVLIVFGIMAACSSSKDPLVTANTLNKIENLANERNFVVEFNTAYPQNTAASQQVLNSFLIQTGNSAGRIDIAGDGAKLTVDGETSTADLPFFGERRMGGSYGNKNVGIEFDQATIKAYKVLRQGEKITVTYGVTNSENDYFDVRMDIYSKYNVRALIISTKKTNMQYDGSFRAVLNTEGDEN